MGANAQTTVPTFTSGQVLTADQQNQSARTGVPVFATAVTRDASFGGAGEKTLAEGQLCYLEDSDVVQYYDGAAWATVGPQAASALTFISETAIGSAVASVTVSNCFSSTYDDYLILIRGYTNSVGDTGFNGWRLGAAGQSTHNSYGFYANATGDGLTSADYCRLGVRKTSANAGIITLLSPNLATNTWGTSIGPALQFPGYYNIYISGTTQYTDFTLIPTANTITGGTIRVYGYAKS
jgi:hypothetical protein